ncbi:hypothetical protein V6N11_067367 [Hibiscus sabdariffa]|uniref:Uncharacterized protein n=1 Tax=Hibiscus sabdariffa TaxID=183260 RepID=A0ABR2SQN0_9ROSI
MFGSAPLPTIEQFASSHGTTSQRHDLPSTSGNDQGLVAQPLPATDGFIDDHAQQCSTTESSDDRGSIAQQLLATERFGDLIAEAIEPDRNPSYQGEHLTCASQGASTSDHLVVASDPTRESASTLVRVTSNIHPMVTKRKNGIVKPRTYVAQYKKVPADIHEALADDD